MYSRCLLGVRNEIDQLLSNDLLFVRQLSEDKSLAGRARDLVFFKTDLKQVNNYSTIDC